MITVAADMGGGKQCRFRSPVTLVTTKETQNKKYLFVG